MTRTDTTTTTTLALVPALVAALFLLPTPAAADHTGWSIGAGFQIGGAHFSLVFGGHDGYRPGYYYRTTQRLHVRAARCSDRCFLDGHRTYHHVSCPLVAAHFGRYHVHPELLFDRFAPPPVWRGQRYRVDVPYRYDRYDRDDRYRRHDHRFDRHDRWSDRRDHRRHSDHYDRDHWRDRRRHDRHDRSDRRRDDRRHDRRHGGRHHDHPGGGPHR